MTSIARRISAGIAASALAVSLVACSQAEDAANKGKEAAGSAAAEATAAAGSAAADATAAAGSAIADATGAAASQGAEATAAAGSAAADASAAAGSAVADATGEAGAAAGELTKVKTPAGEVEVPAAFAEAITAKAAEWGVDVQDIQTTDKGALATFAKDKLLAYANESGATVPVIGKIAETFAAEGGLESALGLPVSPEQVATAGEGWVQEFTGGSISWLKNAAGAFEAKIETK